MLTLDVSGNLGLERRGKAEDSGEANGMMNPLATVTSFLVQCPSSFHCLPPCCLVLILHGKQKQGREDRETRMSHGIDM